MGFGSPILICASFPPCNFLIISQNILYINFMSDEYLTWECPECEMDNSIDIEAGAGVEDLPKILECNFCDHVSDEIDWLY